MDAPDSLVAPVLQQWRLALGALVMALLWVGESWRPIHAGRGRRLAHAATNLGLAGLNTLLVGVIAVALVVVTTRAEAAGFGIVRWLRITGWGQWLAVIVLFDAWQYAWHRMNHRVPLLWRFHAVHHTDREMDATSALRFRTDPEAIEQGLRDEDGGARWQTLPQMLLTPFGRLANRGGP